MTQSYPLHWPEGFTRTTRPMPSKFKTTLASAIRNVQTSLQRFAVDSGRKVENVVISSNYSLTDQYPKESGVAVYFSWDGLSTCIAVDRYPKVEDNLQAIHHCIEAERTKLRHGGLNLVRAAFRGYAALPPPGTTFGKRPWWNVLHVPPDASLKDAEIMYRRMAEKNHPDKGGDPNKMAEINAAIAEARKELGSHG